MQLNLPQNHNTDPSRLILPGNNQVRARKIVRRSNHGHVYKFASLKCARTLELESGLEYDRAIMLEFDPTVIIFQEQPFTLEYADDCGEIRIAYPDLLVFRDDGSSVIEEIKPSSKAANPEIKRKFELEKNALEQHGYGFAIVTELEIRSGLSLKNSKKLLPYRRAAVSSVLREQVLEALRTADKSGLELIQQVYGLTHDLLHSLHSQGFIASDLSLPLTLESYYTALKRQSQLTQQQLRILERRCV